MTGVLVRVVEILFVVLFLWQVFFVGCGGSKK